MRALRDALRSSAAIAQATWVDPLDQGWIAKQKSGALSAADDTTISGKLSTVVQSALR